MGDTISLFYLSSSSRLFFSSYYFYSYISPISPAAFTSICSDLISGYTLSLFLLLICLFLFLFFCSSFYWSDCSDQVSGYTLSIFFFFFSCSFFSYCSNCSDLVLGTLFLSPSSCFPSYSHPALPPIATTATYSDRFLVKPFSVSFYSPLSLIPPIATRTPSGSFSTLSSSFLFFPYLFFPFFFFSNFFPHAYASFAPVSYPAPHFLVIPICSYFQSPSNPLFSSSFFLILFHLSPLLSSYPLLPQPCLPPLFPD